MLREKLIALHDGTNCIELYDANDQIVFCAYYLATSLDEDDEAHQKANCFILGYNAALDFKADR